MRAVLILIALSTSAFADPVSCPAPSQLPRIRHAGGLTVESPPRPAPHPGGGRLRTHVLGSLGKAHVSRDARVWAGPEVPMFVPLVLGTKELFILDLVDDRYMALYRDPYDAGSCKLGDFGKDDTNCDYEVRVFTCTGEPIASLPLNPYFSKTTQLELQDIRLSDNVLYFNEACVSYSKEQGGKCSALNAVDIRDGRLLWRTNNLVSNAVFIVVGGYLITGYGFTAEPSSLFIVRRSDGVVMATQPLKQVVYPGGNHDALTLLANDVLQVGIYEHPDDAFIQLVGISGPKPSFKVIKEPKPISNNFNPDGTPNPSWKGGSPPTLRRTH